MTLPSRRSRVILNVLTAALVLVGIVMIIIALTAGWLVGQTWLAAQIALGMAGLGILLAGLALRVDVVRQWVRKFILSRVALILGGLLMGLLCIEMGLLALELVGIHQINSATRGLAQPIPDPRLGVRLAPYAGGHDANGFRNDAAPDQVDIVAIGDSQTWGINARRSQAWPQTLAKLSGHSTYNMGLGYYGPVQYWVLTEEALKLSPKVIVIGLYLGNDIYDAYHMVYLNDTYSRFRNSGVAADLLNDTIIPRSQVLTDELKEFQAQFQRSNPTGWTGLGHSATVRFLYRRGWWPSATINDAYQADKAWAQAFPNHGAVYESGSVRTVFTTASRLLALDLDEPRIAEGLRITKEMLLDIHAETEAADVALLILLIPTKETVYADAMEILQGCLDETYARLVQMEARARTEIVSLCDENGIEYVDALLVLAEAVQRNEQIYLLSRDGHPNTLGYFLLASAVNDALGRLGWLE